MKMQFEYLLSTLNLLFNLHRLARVSIIAALRTCVVARLNKYVEQISP